MYKDRTDIPPPEAENVKTVLGKCTRIKQTSLLQKLKTFKTVLDKCTRIEQTSLLQKLKTFKNSIR